eukprot:m.326833 g.326833  ORF g.326833 m.326833 type:complete len:161 (-) comp16487_c0_seq4:536-1018(-)
MGRSQSVLLEVMPLVKPLALLSVLHRCVFLGFVPPQALSRRSAAVTRSRRTTRLWHTSALWLGCGWKLGGPSTSWSSCPRRIRPSCYKPRVHRRWRLQFRVYSCLAVEFAAPVVVVAVSEFKSSPSTSPISSPTRAASPTFIFESTINCLALTLPITSNR